MVEVTKEKTMIDLGSMLGEGFSIHRGDIIEQMKHDGL
jgi:hypothetical protein